MDSLNDSEQRSVSDVAAERIIEYALWTSPLTESGVPECPSEATIAQIIEGAMVCHPCEKCRTRDTALRVLSGRLIGAEDDAQHQSCEIALGEGYIRRQAAYYTAYRTVRLWLHELLFNDTPTTEKEPDNTQ